MRIEIPNKQRQFKKRQKIEDFTQKEREFEKEREIEFYAAALDGYYTTSLEYNKGIFTLAAGGLGLLVTLLTTSGLKTFFELLGYLVGISAFSIDLFLLLWIFRLNKEHITHVVQGQEQLSTSKLKRVDFAVMCVFSIGVICAAFVGISAAIGSYDKVKQAADNTPAHPTAPALRNNTVPVLALKESPSAAPVARSLRPTLQARSRTLIVSNHIQQIKASDMANDSTTNDIDVSGLNPANESFSGIGNLHPASIQRSLAGINLPRPNVGGATSQTPQIQPTVSSDASPNAAPVIQANSANSKGK